MTIARLQAFRRILLTLLRMVEEELCERGAPIARAREEVVEYNRG